MQHIAFLSPMASSIRAEIQRLLPAGYTIAFAETNARTEHVQMVATADFLIAAGTFVDADLIQRAPHLKMIQKWGIGVDKIDLEAARQAGLTVAITSGASAAPVSEHAIMLMLAVLRRLPMAHRSLGEGKWIPAALRTVSYQIAGKRIGLLGFGNIARHVAKRLKGFDVKVIYYSRTRADHETEQRYEVEYVDYETLLITSDILSIHIPSNAQTHHQIDAKVLTKMKQGSILINTARGELIDEQALIEAIRTGHLRGAGLDTYEGEPPAADNPLLHMDQVVVTPHSAGAVFDNVANIVGHAFRNIEKFSAGQPLATEDIVVSPLHSATLN
jgi:D-3-phosphoglycerate dehydrogenase